MFLNKYLTKKQRHSKYREVFFFLFLKLYFNDLRFTESNNLDNFKVKITQIL